MMSADGHGCQTVIVGRFDVFVDSAGRFTLPEDWRFVAAGEGQVCLMPDPQEKCLLLLAKGSLDEEVERLKRSHDSDAMLMLNQINMDAHVFSVDESGQVVIPAEQRKYANIKSSATLMGCVRAAKVWATETLNKNEKEIASWNFIEAVMKK